MMGAELSRVPVSKPKQGAWAPAGEDLGSFVGKGQVRQLALGTPQNFARDSAHAICWRRFRRNDMKESKGSSWG
jgi:hypothetical protein